MVRLAFQKVMILGQPRETELPPKEANSTGSLPIIPFQVSRSRGGRCACRQSGIFLCVEPSFLEHNGGIVTCYFSQRYRSQAVVKRSNSKSTIEFP